MAEGAQGGLGCPSTDGTNESFHWRRANPTVRFLISVCSTAHVVVEGPGHNLGRLLLSEGAGVGGGEPAGAGFSCQDSLCSEEGLTVLCVL